MSEKIYNIFLPFVDGRCNRALYVAHDVGLNDQDAILYLQARVEEDLVKAKSVLLAKSFTRSEYCAHIRLGEGVHLYDEVFVLAGAGEAPLCVTTLVVDGRIMVNGTGQHGDPNVYLTPDQIGDAQMDDWLIEYKVGNAIDLPRLIHDDYFLAIKLTYNQRHYVSSLKLLLSCIDSISYIEFGDQPAAFISWLKCYGDLAPVGITPEELWELRNGVLHMTNLNSRKVTLGKVRRISIRIGGEAETDTDTDGIYYFEFYSLIQAFAAALEKWLVSYEAERGKFAKFVERYDETISDSRVLRRPAPGGGGYQ